MELFCGVIMKYFCAYEVQIKTFLPNVRPLKNPKVLRYFEYQNKIEMQPVIKHNYQFIVTTYNFKLVNQLTNKDNL